MTPRRRAAPALVLVAALGCGAPSRAPTQGRCAAAVEVLLREQADVDALADCARLGALVVRSAAPLDLRPLRALAELAGDLRVGPTVSLAVLELPALARVGGAVRVAANAGLTGVFLPRLGAAARVEIESNAALTTVALPRLTRAARLRLRSDVALEVLLLDALVEVDDLELTRVPRLALWQVGQLRRVARWAVQAPALDAGELEAVRARVSAAPR
jgi:hypothetical protein